MKKLTFIGIIIALLGIIAALCFFKMIPTGKILAEGYDIRGVDVSSYQGEIDWAVLSEQGIDFAFIKATEGSTYVDERFSDNFMKASETKLLIGAYHFFSYDSSGESQADNFIRTVPKQTGMIAPVIDLEFYGQYNNSPKKSADVVKEVTAMADELLKYYGIKPIIYVTQKSYRLYIKDTELENYSLWIRNVYFKPMFTSEWAFWQYCDTEELEGYNGDEEKIDMNVFYGNTDDLKNYTIKE